MLSDRSYLLACTICARCWCVVMHHAKGMDVVDDAGYLDAGFLAGNEALLTYTS
jgi:hypothetical protein